MKKIMLVFGTRPDALKLAPVIKELEKYPAQFKVVTVATAQHRQLLDQVLKIFMISPGYDLDIMREGQTLTEVSQRALQKLSPLMEKERPDLVLVQGDTTTSFIAALEAFYHKIPVGHIEAGLRSFDKFNPYPEEYNRKLISVVADLHFAPTQQAKQNLINESVSPKNIFVTGNTVIDALFETLSKLTINNQQSTINNVRIDFNRRIILVTAHRRENWGEPLENICQAIKKLVKRYGDLEIVFPVHPNPRVRSTVERILGGLARVWLIPPVDYGTMVWLMGKTYLCLTDSGGVQEEAPSLGKPVLVLRKVTERPEGVEAGTVKVVGTETSDILRQTSKLLTNKKIYQKMSTAVNPYGDGKASRRIVQAIKYYFRVSSHRPKDFVPENRLEKG